jgi:hypothetical protein
MLVLFPTRLDAQLIRQTLIRDANIQENGKAI